MAWSKLPKGYKSPGYVAVTIYTPAGKPPIVNVYGMYETRAAATADMEKDMTKLIELEGPQVVHNLSYFVRKVNDIPQMNRLMEEQEKQQ